MDALWAWMLTFSWGVPHWVIVTLIIYAVGDEAITQSRLKSNSWVQLVFNTANKVLLPIFGKFPVLGPFLKLLDTPELAVPPAVPPPAPPAVPSKLTLILLIPWAWANGCAHAPAAMKVFGAAYAACMEAKGIAVASSAGQQAFTDLSSGVTQQEVYTQLIAMGGRAGVDAVSCAVESWLHPAATVTAERAPLNPAGVLAASKWLDEHPRSR